MINATLLASQDLFSTVPCNPDRQWTLELLAIRLGAPLYTVSRSWEIVLLAVLLVSPAAGPPRSGSLVVGAVVRLALIVLFGMLVLLVLLLSCAVQGLAKFYLTLQ